jgi:hypothetical protein
MLAAFIPLAKEAGAPLVWVMVFIGALFAAQRFFGGWFEMTRAQAVGSAEAQSKTNAGMIHLIERLTSEIDRLSKSEARIMERLTECESRHRQRDAEFEKMQREVSALTIKLFSVGLGNDPT